MSDLRQDPITGQWVVVSEVRAARPNEYRRVETRRTDLACAFCRGNEHQTPQTLLQIPEQGTDDWSVRVVPNKYPAFTDPPTTHEQADGPYRRLDKQGVQEIVIQSSRHVASYSQLNERELHDGFLAFQSRLRAHQRDPGLAHTMLFTNCRAEAGASLEHLHTQVIGSPIISPSLTSRFDLAEAHFRERGQSTMQSIVQWEMKQQERIITIAGPWVAFCSFASRWPYQVWVASQVGQPRFAACDEQDLRSLGLLVRDLVDRLERLHDFPAYNVLLHQAPNDGSLDACYPWFIEIVPRLTRFAGFELGTGFWINHIPPVIAARELRQLPSSFR